MLVISVLFLAWRGNSHMKMTGLLVSLRRRHCSFWSHFDCARQKANIFNLKCNFVGQQLPTLFNIVGSCCVRLRVALGLCVKKYLYNYEKIRRCHNEALERVLLWLPFVFVTEGDWLWILANSEDENNGVQFMSIVSLYSGRCNCNY